MESFEKRQRERRKREKRTEKEARRKERSALLKKQRLESGTPSTPDDLPVRAGEGPATIPSAQERLP